MARQALWSGFQEHHHATVSITWFSKEGDSNTYQYVIGLDEEGAWRILVNIERRLFNRGLPRNPHPKAISEKYVVSTIRIVSDSGAPISRIPTRTSAQFFRKHRLELLDSTGRLIQRI